MRDLKNPRLIYLKAALFLVSGTLSGGILVLENPTIRTVLLLGITIWAFCRLYYFAFYVIEHYVDPKYRFAGIRSFVLYLRKRR